MCSGFILLPPLYLTGNIPSKPFAMQAFVFKKRLLSNVRCVRMLDAAKIYKNNFFRYFILTMENILRLCLDLKAVDESLNIKKNISMWLWHCGWILLQIDFTTLFTKKSVHKIHKNVMLNFWRTVTWKVILIMHWCGVGVISKMICISWDYIQKQLYEKASSSACWPSYAKFYQGCINNGEGRISLQSILILLPGTSWWCS